MRIIAGKWKGRKLVSPRSMKIRPTSDRVKESCFSIIQSKIEATSVLDLFCGTGNLGLEALSRGASHATFVDNSEESIEIVTKNIQSLDTCSTSAIHRLDAIRFLRRPSKSRSFDIVFMDPPYGKIDMDSILLALANSIHLSPNSLVVLEHPFKEKIKDNYLSLMQFDTRRYGDTSLTFFEIRT